MYMYSLGSLLDDHQEHIFVLHIAIPDFLKNPKDGVISFKRILHYPNWSRYGLRSHPNTPPLKRGKGNQRIIGYSPIWKLRRAINDGFSKNH